MTTSARRRAAVVGGLVVGGLLALAPTAAAHVTVQPGSAVQGSETKVAFRVPNEEDTAATTKLEVTFPTDHPIASVQTRALPGWTATVDKTTLAKPLSTDDGPVTEIVSKITWTGGKIAPGMFEDFEVSVGPLPDDTDKLVFKAVQTYDNGDVVRWIDTPAPGGAEPEHPAPVLTLTAKTATAASQPAVRNAASTTQSSTGTVSLVLGIVGTVLALVAVAFAVLALRRSGTA